MNFEKWWDSRVDETSGPVNVHDVQAAWEAAKRDKWVFCADKMPDPYQTCIVGRTDIPWPITAFWTGQKWCRDVTKEEFILHTGCHYQPRLLTTEWRGATRPYRGASGLIDGFGVTLRRTE